MPDEELMRRPMRAVCGIRRAGSPGAAHDGGSESRRAGRRISPAQWLGLRLLDRRKPDPAHFPLVDDELLDAMRQETTLFARAIMREDRSVLDFLDGRFTFVNGPLARYYGIPGVNGEEFQRVELDGEQRGGVLTQGAILTLSSYATRTSPVLRGKWVLENLLGTPPPPPPPDVPALEEKNLGTTASHAAAAGAAPGESGVRGVPQPDGSDRLRSGELRCLGRVARPRRQVSRSIVPARLPGGASFNGPKELKQVLRAQPDLFVAQSDGEDVDVCAGQGRRSRTTGRRWMRIVRRLAADGYRFSTLVMEVANSEPFQMRKEEIARDNAR